MKQRDHLNEVILPLVGASLLFWLWYADFLPFKIIKAILTEGI